MDCVFPACWEKGADHPVLPDCQEVPEELVLLKSNFGSCQQYFLQVPGSLVCLSKSTQLESKF